MGDGATSGNLAGIDDVRGTPWSKRSPIPMGNRFPGMGLNEDKNSGVAPTIAQPGGNVTPNPAFQASLGFTAPPIHPVSGMEFSFDKTNASPSPRLPFDATKLAESLKIGDPKFNGLKFVLEQLEGGELFDEGNGQKSRYGIGVGNSKKVDPTNLTIDQAMQAYKKYYPDTIFDNLKDEYDKAVFANLKLHRPAWANEFVQIYKGPYGGKEFRDALLAFQEAKYNETDSPYKEAWLNRVNKVRNILPVY